MRNVNLVNLTPHAINMYGATIPPSGKVARIKMEREDLSPLIFQGQKVRVTRTYGGEIEGLPAPSPGKAYIVSRVVLEVVKVGRGDVFSPGELIRDSEGRVIGCDGLSR